MAERSILTSEEETTRRILLASTAIVSAANMAASDYMLGRESKLAAATQALAELVMQDAGREPSLDQLLKREKAAIAAFKGAFRARIGVIPHV